MTRSWPSIAPGNNGDYVRLFRRGNPIQNKAITVALGELWQAAGRPTSRRLAKDAKCSHSTVAEALSGRRVPALRTLLGIVEALDGDGQYFVDLYEDTQRTIVPGPSSRVLLTGILEELRAIRALLERGQPEGESDS